VPNRDNKENVMIIALYKSNYPVELQGTPKWEELPDGYFIVPEDDIMDQSKISLQLSVVHSLFPKV
jgi:hypothetical protein